MRRTQLLWASVLLGTSACANATASSGSGHGHTNQPTHAHHARKRPPFGARSRSVRHFTPLPRGGTRHTPQLVADDEVLLFADESDEAQSSPSEAESPSQPITYPPLTADEMSNSLRRIRLYCLVRKSDGGLLVASDGGSRKRSRLDQRRRLQAGTEGGLDTAEKGAAVYFFLSKKTAEANLAQVQQQQQQQQQQDGKRAELQLSTALLGKLWDKFFRINTTNNNKDKTSNEVDFRLVPDSEELLRSRFLLTVSEQDLSGATTANGRISEATGRRLMQKVSKHPARFQRDYNDIPLFVAPQLRFQRRKRRTASKWPKLMVPFRRRRQEELIMPIYLSMEDLQSDLQRVPELVNGNSNTATAIMGLEELLRQMTTQESVDFDFRDVEFVPSGGKMSGTPVAAIDPAESQGKNAAGSDYEKGSSRLRSTQHSNERYNFLRPRRRINARDLEELFGPDI